MKQCEILFKILLVCMTQVGFAQIPHVPLTMLSPNAAALGEYGDVPVSEFTGIPNIEIPIYRMHCGDREIPVMLRYHSGGVRPDQHPGSLGVGWTLSAGGCISRVINDAPDEYDWSTAPSDYSFMRQAGYYYHYNQLNNANLESSEWINAVVNDDRLKIDFEPDVFTFNFLGYSGRFFLGEDGEWKVQCDKAIKILFNEDEPKALVDPYENCNYKLPFGHSFSRSFGKFTIIGEDGTQYHFGVDDNNNDNNLDDYAVEYSIDFFNQEDGELFATTWHLTRIVYPDTREVRFRYERGDEKNGFNYNAQFYIGNVTPISYHYMGYGIETILNSTYINPKNLIKGQLITPSYLISIKTPTEELAFEYEEAADLQYDMYEITDGESFANGKDGNGDEGVFYSKFPYLTTSEKDDWSEVRKDLHFSLISWRKIKRMTLYTGGNNLRQSFLFSYNDDGHYLGNTIDQRLLLKGLEEAYVDELGVVKETSRHYSFDYYSPELLPPYLSKQTDHWGFYNGKNNTFDDINNFYNSKEPDNNNLQVYTYGTLKKITYPTGGWTEFEFETNRYSRQVNEHRDGWENTAEASAGGLRIKKIKSVSDQSQPMTEIEYFYVRGYNGGSASGLSSSGVLGTRAQYIFSNYAPTNISGSGDMVFTLFSAQSMLPGSENACGIHVGYSEVVKRWHSGAYNVYKYTNFDNGYADEKADYYLQTGTWKFGPYTSKSFERGLLMCEEKYEKRGNESRLSEKKIITYEYGLGAENKYARAFKKRAQNYIEFYDDGYNPVRKFEMIRTVEGGIYRQYYDMPRIKSEVDTIYFYNRLHPSVLKRSYQYYEYNKQIKELRYEYGNGRVVRTCREYPSDTLCNNLFEAHVLDKVIREFEYKTDYDNIEKQSIKRRLYFDNNICKPTRVYRALRDYPFEKQRQVTYDSKCNEIYVIDKHKNHNVFLYGYDNEYCIAAIENATLDQVNQVLGGSDGNSTDIIEQYGSAVTPDFSKVDLLRKSLSDAKVTTYEYLPGIGISKIIMPNGEVIEFGYDHFGRLNWTKDNESHLRDVYNYHYAE